MIFNSQTLASAAHLELPINTVDSQDSLYSQGAIAESMIDQPAYKSSYWHYQLIEQQIYKTIYYLDQLMEKKVFTVIHHLYQLIEKQVVKVIDYLRQFIHMMLLQSKQLAANTANTANTANMHTSADKFTCASVRIIANLKSALPWQQLKINYRG
jgi:hypothetical protein